MKTLILLVLALSVNAMDLISTLKQEEGFRSTPYKCSMGFWTIGYGHQMAGKKQTPISQETAEMWLAEDIAKAMSRIDDLVGKDAPLEVKQIVTAMVFQLGFEGVKKFKNTLQLIRSKDYLGASKEMLKSEWATQTPARAKRMSELMSKV